MLPASPLGSPEPALATSACRGRWCGQVEQGLQVVEQLGRGGGPGATTAPPAAGRHPGQLVPPHDDITAGCPHSRPRIVNRSVPSTGPAASDPALTDLANGKPAADQPVPVGLVHASRPGTGNLGWPPDALALAQGLQRSLTIDERQWHRLKAQRPRRAAEQLAAALVQLLAADDPKCSSATPAREEATALVQHALGWLTSDISDPGCPSHGR
jgi:hypothetical protein